MSSTFAWQFGGWLRAWPPTLAWSLLGVLAAAGFGLVLWSYRHTLRGLTPGRRIALTTLRVIVVLALLLCLANPSRVQRSQRGEENRHTLYVLVDRSDSMSTPDYRGATRLASALRLWQEHAGEAASAFTKVQYFRFADRLNAASTLEEATTQTGPGDETHLFETLGHLIDQAPGAIVSLTDGLDTTTQDSATLIASAQQHGVPLYFIPGTNRTQAGEVLDIRELKAPSGVLRQTQFTASVLLKTGKAKDGLLPVELWSGDKQLASTDLPVRAGVHLVPWSVPINASEPGSMPLEFRIGSGVHQQIAACTTRIVEQTKVPVLYYQGALQWGYRYLLTALESDPSFQMTSILNPALGIQITSGDTGQPTLPDLPDDARDLKPYRIVILAHVFADLLTPRQQQALLDYARGGGGVLFIAPDSEATSRFVGTDMEQMLPVIFDPRHSEESAVGTFEAQMANSTAGTQDTFLDENSNRVQMPQLHPFALPTGVKSPALAMLFKNLRPDEMPRFANYARVRGAKAGADVLAVSGDAGDGAAPILLARQQFGDGFTAALTTDLLWRWKMSLPSSSHAAETFWQQLLLSLAPAPAEGLRIVRNTESPTMNAPVSLRITGASGDHAPTLTLISPTGEKSPLTARYQSEQDSHEWSASFNPAAIGRWEVQATDATGNAARLTFNVAKKVQTTETLNLPPNVDQMRELADSTGGALIGEEPAFQANATTHDDSSLQMAHIQPLWNSSWLLALMLGLYATELIVRRCFRLL
ncbi:MAG: hypothetical protein QM796_10300 [Chthoniobacteraceae bacterium]